MRAFGILLLVDLVLLSACAHPVAKVTPSITTGISSDLSAADAKAVLIQQWANQWSNQNQGSHP